MLPDREPVRAVGASQAPLDGDTLWWPALLALVAAAAFLRLLNLGDFSLALDEVFTLTRAKLPFDEMIAACAVDAENVPVYLLLAYASIRAGLVEPWLRLVPIAAGLASIVAWAVWTRRHFGARASLLVAGFMAISTFHIRYSQELRAYPYLLLLAAAVLLATDRLRRRADLQSALVLAALVTLGWYTHFSFAMLIPPLFGAALLSANHDLQPRPARTRVLMLTTAAVAVGTLAFVPWFLYVARTLSGRLSRGAIDWNLDLIGRRWQFLTVAASEGEPVDWLGMALAGLAAVGFVVALRHEVGRRVIAPAVAAMVGGEALLVAVNRWSKGRYDTAVWPLLVMLIALGSLQLALNLRRRWMRVGLLAIVACAMLIRVDAYHRLGRPHWDRAAQAIAETIRPGEPVLAENRWSQWCLAHYSADPVRSLDRSPSELAAALGQAPSVLLFAPDRHRLAELQRLARRGIVIADVPQTGRLIRLRPDMLDPASISYDGAWPDPAAALVSASIEQALPGWLSPRLRCASGRSQPERVWSRLELDATSEPYLHGGWSSPKTANNGCSFRRISGREAAVVAPLARTRASSIQVRLWPVQELEEQSVRILVNGHELGVTSLAPGRQTIALECPASHWRVGENLIVLQLARAIDPHDGRSLPRGASVDWIEVRPAGPPT